MDEPNTPNPAHLSSEVAASRNSRTRRRYAIPVTRSVLLALALAILAACEAPLDHNTERGVAVVEAGLKHGARADGRDFPSWFRSDFGVGGGSISATVFPDRKAPALAYLSITRKEGETFVPELYRTHSGGNFWRRVRGVVGDGQLILGVLPRPDRAAEAYLGLGFPGALLRTRNGGASFQDITAGLENPTYIQPVAIAPENPRVLYILGGLERSRTVELMRSEDGGQSWRSAFVPFDRGCCCSHVVATSETRAYASSFCPNTAASPGLQKTEDGGQSWSPLALDLTFVDLLAVDPRDANTLYAAGGRPDAVSGLRKSTDGGQTWFAPNEEFAARPISALTLSRSGRMYLAANDAGQGVFTSRDGAVSFQPAGDGLEGQLVTSLAAKPANPCAAYAVVGGTTLFRTEDGGGTCHH